MARLNLQKVAAFNSITNRLIAASTTPRGRVDTAFTVKELATFVGVTPSRIYQFIAEARTASVKTNAFGRNKARVLIMDAFFELSRKKGKHNVFKKHCDEVYNEVIVPILEDANEAYQINIK